jgi:DNA-binding IclR family transcriptional regulator
MNRIGSLQRKTYRVQAVERAFDIMDCFDFQNRDLTLSEIARAAGLNKTTTSRLTSNLVARGYLKFDPVSQRYSLGIRLFELGGVVFSSFSLRKSASRHMTALQQETGSTVLLGVLIDNQLVYVDRREGNEMVRIVSDIGWRRPPHFGMLGMVLMAALPPEQITDLLSQWPLEPFTSVTITDPQAFRLRLAEISRDGYVVERGEAWEGIIGVAAPIRDHSQRVIAAIGVGLLAARHEESSLARTVAAVRSAANAISADLGYTDA